jgi:DNA-directed RNA polymerase specialized sigma24 family protein
VTDRPALPTLIELVDAARAGSEPALNAVLANVEPALRDLLMHRYWNLHDPAIDPNDLLQLALIRISERIATCTATDSRGFVAWCLTVAHRVGLSELRKSKRAPQFLPLVKDIIDAGPDISDDELHDLLARGLVAAAVGIPSDTHSLVVGRYIEEETWTVLGARSDLNPPAARQRVLRACARMGEQWASWQAELPEAERTALQRRYRLP